MRETNLKAGPLLAAAAVAAALAGSGCNIIQGDARDIQNPPGTWTYARSGPSASRAETHADNPQQQGGHDAAAGHEAAGGGSVAGGVASDAAEPARGADAGHGAGTDEGAAPGPGGVAVPEGGGGAQAGGGASAEVFLARIRAAGTDRGAVRSARMERPGELAVVLDPQLKKREVRPLLTNLLGEMRDAFGGERAITVRAYAPNQRQIAVMRYAPGANPDTTFEPAAGY
jgi:hypothetical protein